ncbi:hypothetical protein GCM10023092_18130 [Rurimicrobium arvi]|uniref:Transposase n=1 Tax=Rurimicrobium arvi TaxID=2049916 RepID=A0ABP8MVA6_9BACT
MCVVVFSEQVSLYLNLMPVGCECEADKVISANNKRLTALGHKTAVSPASVRPNMPTLQDTLKI